MTAIKSLLEPGTAAVFHQSSPPLGATPPDLWVDFDHDALILGYGGKQITALTTEEIRAGSKVYVPLYIERLKMALRAKPAASKQ